MNISTQLKIDRELAKICSDMMAKLIDGFDSMKPEEAHAVVNYARTQMQDMKNIISSDPEAVECFKLFFENFAQTTALIDEIVDEE